MPGVLQSMLWYMLHQTEKIDMAMVRISSVRATSNMQQSHLRHLLTLVTYDNLQEKHSAGKKKRFFYN